MMPAGLAGNPSINYFTLKVNVMSYTYAIDPRAMFEDRFKQFVAFGIPRADVEVLQATITDMWADVPGGWPFEWSAFARKYMEAGNPLLASIAYGCAKFPCLANEARRKALQNQLAAYLIAAPAFPVHFERRVMALPFLGDVVNLPVHLFSKSGQYTEKPVLLFSGGVDTYKMDAHTLIVALAQKLDVTVLAFDQPGTAENPVALSIQGDEMVLGLVNQARKLGNGTVFHFGMSFGANFSAMTGLSGAVDAAVVLGGPIEKCWLRENLETLPYGMPGIIGNDMGFDHELTLDEFTAAVAAFSRSALLDSNDNSPMLVINGAADVFIPKEDTLIFEGRKNTEVHLLPGTGHCASSKLPEVIDLVCDWLPNYCNPDTASPQ
jgi:esterase FrsA